MAILETKSLSTGFGDKVLLKKLSLVIPDKSFVAIIGHNGSGKTTFFKSLTHQHAYKGSVVLRGHEVHTLPSAQLATYLTFLEQKNSISFDIPVLELVVMGRFRFMKFFDSYGEQDYQMAREALQCLEAGHLAKKSFLDLSGGEQQLVWIAQVMLQDTPLLLLDEPTQQLDIYNRKKVFALMMDWVRQKEKTVLCVTHDLLNLYSMEGYLINFSRPNPVLETLSRETVDSNLHFLESSPLLN